MAITPRIRYATNGNGSNAECFGLLCRVFEVRHGEDVGVPFV